MHVAPQPHAKEPAQCTTQPPSVQIGDVGNFGIAPQLLQLIEVAILRQKHMYINRAIIEHNPLAVLISVVIIRFHAGMLLHILTHAVGNCRHLHGGSARTYNEVLCCHPLNARHIDVSDAFSFSFLYSFYNRFNQIVLLRHKCHLKNFSAKIEIMFATLGFILPKKCDYTSIFLNHYTKKWQYFDIK